MKEGVSILAAAIVAAAASNVFGLPTTGFYRIDRRDDGRWWVVSPDGSDTFMRGIDHANWNGHFCEALNTNPYRDEMAKKFAGLNSAKREIWEEAGRVCDAVTFNNYPWADLDRNVLLTSRTSGIRAADAYAERHAWTGKPLIITEWGYSALDSGLPCSGGAGQRFRTQRERVAASESLRPHPHVCPVHSRLRLLHVG